MLKKVLVGLAILLVLAITMAMEMKGFYKNTNASAKEYIDRTAPKILSDWSSQEFLHYSHPRLNAQIEPKELDIVFKKYASLGKLKNYSGAQDGKIELGFSEDLGKYKISTHQTLATFENGQAVITFQIAQNHRVRRYRPPTEMTSPGEWKILSMSINSDHFLE